MPNEKKLLQILIYSKIVHYKSVLLFVDWFLSHYYIIHQRLGKPCYVHAHSVMSCSLRPHGL